jgi:hypothetical protein
VVTTQFGLLGTVNGRRSAAAVPLSTRLRLGGTLLLEAQAAGISHPSPPAFGNAKGACRYSSVCPGLRLPWLTICNVKLTKTYTRSGVCAE